MQIAGGKIAMQRIEPESEAAMSAKTARERLHQLIDELTEEQAEEIELLVKLSMLPEDDEPETEEERQAVEESREAYRRGEVVAAEEIERSIKP